MFTIYLGLAGVLALGGGAVLLGLWLRRHPSKANAEKGSRIMHFLFFAGWGIPSLLGVFYPGPTRFDELLGVAPLPWRPVFIALGVILALPGLYLLVVSNQLLRRLGSGTNAFRLTKQMVAADIYQRTRNPMSLGFYMLALATALMLGSTVLTLGILLGLIPAHLLFIKYFEQKELELRFGESYLDYEKRVPFLFPRL